MITARKTSDDDRVATSDGMVQHENDDTNDLEHVYTEDEVREYDVVINHPRRQGSIGHCRYQELRGPRRKISLDEAKKILDKFQQPMLTPLFNEPVRPRLLKRKYGSVKGDRIYVRASLEDIIKSVNSKRCKTSKKRKEISSGIETSSEALHGTCTNGRKCGSSSTSTSSSTSASDESIDGRVVSKDDTCNFEPFVLTINESGCDDPIFLDDYFSKRAKVMKLMREPIISFNDDSATVTTIDETSVEMSSLGDNENIIRFIDMQLDSARPRTLREIIQQYGMMLNKIEGGEDRYRKESQAFRKTLDAFLTLPYVDHVPIDDSEFDFHGYYVLQNTLRTLWCRLCNDCLELPELDGVETINTTKWFGGDGEDCQGWKDDSTLDSAFYVDDPNT